MEYERQQLRIKQESTHRPFEQIVKDIRKVDEEMLQLQQKRAKLREELIMLEASVKEAVESV